MSTRLRTLLALSAFAALGLLAPTHVMAGAASSAAWFTIDDAGLSFGNSNNMAASLSDTGFITPTSLITVSGPFNFVISVSPESPTTFGTVGAQFDYFDGTPMAVGATSTVNFNIFGPNEPLSDTLSVTFTRITVGAGNTHVNLNFLSDNDVLTLSQLSNGLTITETGAYQDLSTQVASATGLSTFHLRFASDAQPVPLPSAVWSGTALLSAMCAITIIRRRRRAVA